MLLVVGNMDDWKLKVRTSVKLEKDINMFVCSYLLFVVYSFII